MRPSHSSGRTHKMRRSTNNNNKNNNNLVHGPLKAFEGHIHSAHDGRRRSSALATVVAHQGAVVQRPAAAVEAAVAAALRGARTRRARGWRRVKLAAKHGEPHVEHVQTVFEVVVGGSTWLLTLRRLQLGLRHTALLLERRAFAVHVRRRRRLLWHPGQMALKRVHAAHKRARRTHRQRPIVLGATCHARQGCHRRQERRVVADVDVGGRKTCEKANAN